MFLLRYILYLLIVNFSLSKDHYTFLPKSEFTNTLVNQSNFGYFGSLQTFSVTSETNRISDFFEISETLEDSFHKGDGDLPTDGYLKTSKFGTLKELQILCNKKSAPFKRFNLYIYFLQLKIPFVKG